MFVNRSPARWRKDLVCPTWNGGKKRELRIKRYSFAVLSSQAHYLTCRRIMTYFRLFPFILLFTIVHPVFSQKPGLVFPTGVAGKDYNAFDTKGKKTGLWVRVYQSKSDVLYYRGQFENNVPVGTFDFFYETGDLKSKVTHVQDTTVNDVVNFHTDGLTVIAEGRYLGKVIDKKFVRQKEGVWKLYDVTGILRAEENYKDGMLDGVCKYMYENGKLVSNTLYLNGRKEGPFTDYYETGKKQREGSYSRGEFTGPFVSFYPTGAKESEGTFDFGQREGTWRYYETDGNIRVSILYKKGAEVKRKYENGTITLYYDSGLPKSEYTYVNGSPDGPFTEWFDLGQFVQVPGTKEDQLAGIAYREKLEGTQISKQGDYMNGLLEGEVTYFSEKGSVLRVEVYAQGVLVSSRGPEKK